LLLRGKCNPNATDDDNRCCLHLAASQGHREIVHSLIKANANVNCVDMLGGTPLSDAVREGHKELAVELHELGGELKYEEEQMSEELSQTVRHSDFERLELMIRVGCCVNARDKEKRTCLHAAAGIGDVKMANRLIEIGADIDAKDHYGVTPLAVAVREGSHAIACRLVELNAHVNFDKTTTANELCKYASHGDVEGIRILLAGGADVNAADHRGRTCLHLAASAGRLSVMEELLRVENLNINPVDAGGGTPLLDALRENQPKLAAMLFERNGSLSLPDDVASLRLATLARHGELEQISKLIAYGCNVNTKDYNARTIMHVVAGETNTHLVDLIISLGGDVNATDWHGRTPLDEAMARNNTVVAHILRDKGAKLGKRTLPSQLSKIVRAGRLDKLEEMAGSGCDMNTRDDDGRTPLHLAAGYGYLHLVEFLVKEAKADPHIKDPRGATALDYALHAGHQHIVAFLSA